jgi:hypothetical protein
MAAKITVSADCGNSPRKLFLKDLHIALANGDISLITASLEDDIVWERVGDKRVDGKAAVVSQLVPDKIAALTITTIITHGKDAAVQGERILDNGKKLSFCEVYLFKGAKGNTLKSITSYVIEIS